MNSWIDVWEGTSGEMSNNDGSLNLSYGTSQQTQTLPQCNPENYGITSRCPGLMMSGFGPITLRLA